MSTWSQFKCFTCIIIVIPVSPCLVTPTCQAQPTLILPSWGRLIRYIIIRLQWINTHSGDIKTNTAWKHRQIIFSIDRGYVVTPCSVELGAMDPEMTGWKSSIYLPKRLSFKDRFSHVLTGFTWEEPQAVQVIYRFTEVRVCEGKQADRHRQLHGVLFFNRNVASTVQNNKKERTGGRRCKKLSVAMQISLKG